MPDQPTPALLACVVPPTPDHDRVRSLQQALGGLKSSGEIILGDDTPPGYALVDTEGRCGCCYATGEHRCGSECYSCDGSGKDPDSPICTVPHGPDCRCTTRAMPWEPPAAPEQPEGSDL